MDETEQAAAIVLELQGPVRDLFREMTHVDFTQGGLIAGQQAGPVTFIIAQLAQTFAPLGEEVRLQALQDLMTFHRLPNERIDELQTRFRILRHRAQNQGAGLAMSWGPVLPVRTEYMSVTRSPREAQKITCFLPNKSFLTDVGGGSPHVLCIFPSRK